jgi:acetoin utilization deacetylase AcuC-like enzyme
MSKTAVIWDERMTYHEMGYLHPESPRRLIAINDVLKGDGVGREVVRVDPRPATVEEIGLIHDEHYIERIKGTDGKDVVHLDPDTSTNRFTWEAAILAAGGTIVCAEKVASGEFSNAFAFVRPPGHHSERGKAMGFCVFNNVAVAAEWLIRNKKCERVAILDFDVHHGNGTQRAFYKRADVFFASVHRYPFYPGTGSAEEAGEGAGKGFNFNIPLDGGAHDDDFLRAVDAMLKKFEKFAPEFLLVSAGFDAHKLDPLGGMEMTTEGYGRIMQELVDFASATCKGKLVAVLEGGYNLQALRESVETQLEVMVQGG